MWSEQKMNQIHHRGLISSSNIDFCALKIQSVSIETHLYPCLIQLRSSRKLFTAIDIGIMWFRKSCFQLCQLFLFTMHKRKIENLILKFEFFARCTSAGCLTWVKVVRCRRRAGVGHETVVGVCPAWGNDEMPLPGDDMPLPDTDDRPLFGSGFSFLNAPSAEKNERGN